MWSPDGVPNNNASDVYDVGIDGGKAISSLVTLDISATINTLTIDSGDGLVVDAIDLTIAGGSIVNNGALTVTNSGFLAYTGNLSLSGSGTMRMGNAQIFGTTSSDRVTNGAGHTIVGTGSIGGTGNPITVTNAGVINASSATVGFLGIFPSASGVINTGTMQAAPDAVSGNSTAVLQLNSGSYTNTGGVIQALTTESGVDGVQIRSGASVSGGTVLAGGNADARLLIGDGASVSDAIIKASEGAVVKIYTGSTITGGDFQTGGGGVISVLDNGSFTETATFDGVTNSGLVGIGANTFVTLKGTVTNNGSISFTGGNNLSGIATEGGATLSGSGAITLSSADHVIGAGSGAGDSLTNGANHTIEGRGQIGGLTSNLGTVTANGSAGSLVFFPHANGSANSGIMEATSGRTLTFSSGTARTVTNDGVIQAIGTGSTVDLSSQTLTVDGTGEFIADGGTIDLRPAVGSAAAINTTGPITARNSGLVESGGQALTSSLVTTETNGQVQLNGGSLGGGSVDNRGAINTTGAVTISSDVVNRGSINAASGSTISFTGDVSGTGSFTGTTNFAGTLSPGLSPATVSVGTISLESTSTLVMEIGGVNAGTGYDQLTASGTVSILGGTLNLELINGFNPAQADQFTIITGTIASGAAFDNAPRVGNTGVLVDPDGDTVATVTYNADSIVISNVAAVPEPSTYALCGLGLLIPLVRRLRK